MISQMILYIIIRGCMYILGGFPSSCFVHIYAELYYNLTMMAESSLALLII